LGDQLGIADAALDEDMPGVVLQAGQVFQIAGVGQVIEVDDGFVGQGQPVEDKVAANEAGGAGDDNAHSQYTQLLMRQLSAI